MKITPLTLQTQTGKVNKRHAGWWQLGEDGGPEAPGVNREVLQTLDFHLEPYEQSG